MDLIRFFRADCVVRTSSQWFYPPVSKVHSLAAIPQSLHSRVQTVGSDFDQTWRVWDGDGWKEDCNTLIFLSWLTCVQRLLSIYLFSQFHANQVHSPALLSPFQQHDFYFQCITTHDCDNSNSWLLPIFHLTPPNISQYHCCFSTSYIKFAELMPCKMQLHVWCSLNVVDGGYCWLDGENSPRCSIYLIVWNVYLGAVLW